MNSNWIVVVLLAVLGLGVLVQCDDAANPDVGLDAGVDAGPDVGLDADVDTAPDQTTTSDGNPDIGVPTPATWVPIPAGQFTMGSPTSEPCREPGTTAKETQHQVTLTHKFEIQSTEVTQGQFKSLMGSNPSFFSSCGTNCPVEQVTWHEAAAYCNALSDKKGYAKCYTCNGVGKTVSCTDDATYNGSKIYACPGYRLPTEAEWEYAYRAGTTTAYYSGANDSTACKGCTKKDANADKIGWYQANATVTYAGCMTLSGCGCLGTHPVGQKQKNAWNLYDMAGNVWEWCHDYFQADLGSSAVSDPWGSATGSVHVMRGGCWLEHAHTLRAAAHPYFTPQPTPPPNHRTIGFRCVRTN